MTPLEECNAVIVSIAAKADKNKRRARLSVIFLTATTALIPLLLIMSTAWADFVLGKLLPALLAATAAIGAGLVQIERPHERWNLYRRYQRQLEAERLQYVHKTGDYEKAPEPDRLLVEQLAKYQIDLHNEWAGLIPASSEVASLGKTAPSA